jgi:hypothetical protein
VTGGGKRKTGSGKREAARYYEFMIRNIELLPVFSPFSHPRFLTKRTDTLTQAGTGR